MDFRIYYMQTLHSLTLICYKSVDAEIVCVCTNNNRPIFIRCIFDILRLADINSSVKYLFTKCSGDPLEYQEKKELEM